MEEPEVNQEQNEVQEQEEKQPVTYTEEEMSKRIEQEAERRVQKAHDKWEKAQAAKLEEAKSEGAKLAKMTAQEKAEAEQEKRMKELEAREQEINKRELTANVRDVLTDKGLPVEMAESLVTLGDADVINQTTDTLAKLIDKRVNEQVDSKLSGAGKPTGSSDKLNPKGDLTKALGL